MHDKLKHLWGRALSTRKDALEKKLNDSNKEIFRFKQQIKMSQDQISKNDRDREWIIEELNLIKEEIKSSREKDEKEI